MKCCQHQGCGGAGTWWNAVPANTVGHRWNANTEVYFLAQIVPPQTWDWASKI